MTDKLSLDSNEKFDSLEALFGASLDDIADLPAFEAPPPGAYILDINMDTKKINDKWAIEASFAVVETVALKNDVEGSDGYRAPSAPGTKFSTAFFLKDKDGKANVNGIARMKQLLVPFAEHFGDKDIQKLVTELVKNVRIAAVVTNRADKEDPEKIYAGVRDIMVQ